METIKLVLSSMVRQMVWMIGLTFKLDLSYGYSDF